MPLDQDSILDPAHDPADPGTNVGAAGIASPEVKADKPEPRVSEDGNVLEHNGRKYVTQEALHRERQEKQQLKETLATLDPVLPEFEEFLKVRQNRRTSAREGVAARGEQDDPEYLTEVASALGFFDEKNEPDLRRAQAHLNITRREADRSSARAIKPLEESTARERSSANRDRARANVFADGQPVAGQKYMDAAFDALTPEQLSDPNIANITQVIAAGLEYLDHRKNGTLSGSRQSRQRGSEPMFVERGSSRYDSADDGLSDLDLAAARARGKTPEQWAKLSKQINPARGGNRGTNVLEDV